MRSSTVSGPRLDARPRGEPRIVPWAGPPPPGLQGYQSLAQPVELHRLARDHVLAEGAGGAGHRHFTAKAVESAQGARHVRLEVARSTAGGRAEPSGGVERCGQLGYRLG
jgi:hypothetical protein